MYGFGIWKSSTNYLKVLLLITYYFYLTKIKTKQKDSYRDWQESWDSWEVSIWPNIPCMIWGSPTFLILLFLSISLVYCLLYYLCTFFFWAFPFGVLFQETLLFHHSSICSFDIPQRSIHWTLCFFISLCPTSFFFIPLRTTWHFVIYFSYVHYTILSYTVSLTEYKYFFEVR